MYERHELDVDAFLKRDRTGPCFVCQIVACAPDASPHIIYEDAVAIAFLDKYPPEYGWTLVAPRAHRTQVTGDFTVDEYLQLQHLVYRVSEAVRYEVNAERMYLCSLGRNQGNAHVHWHIAPVPQGMPFDEQGPDIFRSSRLDISENEQAALATRLQQRLQKT